LPPRHELVESSLMLRPKISRPVCLGIKHPFESCDQMFITVRELRVGWYGALSLMRGRIWHLQLMLALASPVILGSEFRGTREHILLSQIRNFPFLHRTIRRATGRYLTPPPHGISNIHYFFGIGPACDIITCVSLFLFVNRFTKCTYLCPS
jgi:hypothetical protein